MTNIQNLPPNTRDAIARKITGMGYGENVVDDEIQAYLSTGVGDEMKRIKDIKKAQIPFVDTFDSYSKRIKPNRIPINWSTDLDR